MYYFNYYLITHTGECRPVKVDFRTSPQSIYVLSNSLPHRSIAPDKLFGDPE